MWMLACVVGGALVGAVGFRVRGGWFGERIGWGATKARVCAWAVPMAVVALVASWGSPWWLGLGVGVAAFAGATLPTWGAIDAGRVEGSRERDAAMNALRGLLMGMALMVPFMWAGAGAAAASMWSCWTAALVAGSYEAAWGWGGNARVGPTEAAELLVGAGIGGMVAFCSLTL